MNLMRLASHTSAKYPLSDKNPYPGWFASAPDNSAALITGISRFWRAFVPARTSTYTYRPDGRISRYLYGVDYAPRDLRLALVEAAERKIGSPVDELLLFCYHYDPATGRYGLVIMRTIRVAGAATVVALAAFITIMVRRERAPGPHEKDIDRQA